MEEARPRPIAREVIRRGDAAYELWCELVRRATGKEYKRDL